MIISAVVGTIIGASVSGIIGNRADQAFVDLSQNIKNYFSEDLRLKNHDLQKAVLRSYYAAVKDICEECLTIEKENQTAKEWLKDEIKFADECMENLDKHDILFNPIDDIDDIKLLISTEGDKTETFRKLNARVIPEKCDSNHYKKIVEKSFYQRVCGYFAYEIKTNEAVNNIFQSQILANVSIQTTQIINMLSNIGASFLPYLTRIDEAVQVINKKSDKILDISDKILELETQKYSGNTIQNIYINTHDYRQLREDIEELQADLAEMDSSHPRRAAKERALKEKWDSLEALKQTVLTLAKTFNNIKVDSERIRIAREHFENGRFKEADAVLKTEDIDKEVKSLKERELKLGEEMEKTRSQLSDCAKEYLLKAELQLTFVDDKNRFKNAEKLFEKALAVDRNAEILFKYAYYLYNQKQYSRVEPLYAEALEIYRKLAEVNPEVYASDVASALNNLAVLHKNKNQYEEAEKEYEEALEIRRKLAEANPEAYASDVARTLYNLAILHDDKAQYEEAEKEYEEALEIYRELAADSPEVYSSYVAMTLNNLAVLHYGREQYSKSENELTEALNLYRKLAKINSKIYESDVAGGLSNLGELYAAIEQYKKAEEDYVEALEIYRKLAADNPEVYSSDMAMTLNNLAALHGDKKQKEQYEKAEKEYVEALEIRRKLAADNPEVYSSKVAMTLNNLALLHDDKEQYEEAEKEYVEALEIYRELAKNNPEIYESDVAEILEALDDIHNKMK